MNAQQLVKTKFDKITPGRHGSNLKPAAILLLFNFVCGLFVDGSEYLFNLWEESKPKA